LDLPEHSEHRTARRRSRRRSVAVAALCLLAVVATASLIFHRAGSIRVKREVDAIRAAGEPVTFAELDALRKRIPDDQNSARTIEPLLKRLPTSQPTLPFQNNRSAWSELGERLSPEMLAVARQYLELVNDLLASLHEAVRFPEGAFAVGWTQDGFSTMLPHLGPLRQCGRMVCFEAFVRAQQGQADAAAAGVVDALRLAASLRDEPILVSQLVRGAMQDNAIAVFEQVLSITRPSDAAIDAVAAELARAPVDLEMYRMAMLGERCSVIAFLQSLRGGNAGGIAMALGAPKSADLLRLVPGYIELNEQRCLQLARRYVAATALPMPEFLREMKTLDAVPAQNSPFYIVARLISPQFGQSAKTYVGHCVRARVALAAVEAEKSHRRQGRWPASLEELCGDPKRIPLDPFNGDQPLRYRRTDTGCVIYSVGQNGIDEGGMPGMVGRPNDISFVLLSPEHRGVRTTTQPFDREAFEREISECRLPPPDTAPAK
jgi:hypothetical protein